MPKIPEEKKCMFCRFWGFKRRQFGGTAYCFKKNDWIPKQRDWLTIPNAKKPGERLKPSCWEPKG